MPYAFVPIKHESTRVRSKNFRDFNGRPLYRIIIDTLLSCTCFDGIIIDTDSPVILNDSYLTDNKHILIHKRPESLRPGDTSVNNILIRTLTDLNINQDELILQTHVTNPLLTATTIERAMETFICHKDTYDSLFSVKRWQTRLYDHQHNAINHNPNELIPTQNLNPVWEENSCIYIFSLLSLQKHNHRIGNRPYLFNMSAIESQDIDIEHEFTIAELLHQQRSENIVLVTGVNGGIGSAIAVFFAKNGCHVIGTDLHTEPQKLNQYQRYITADLTNPYAVSQLIDNISKTEGKLDCIINVAAVQICKPIWQMEEDEWDKVMNCNLKTIFRFAKLSKNLLQCSNNANIINIGSVHSVATSDQIAAYSCSKAAVVGLTRNLAIELAPFGIRVNTVSPGAVDTPMLRSGLRRGHLGSCDDHELVERLAQQHLLGKVATPEQIASMVYYITTNKFLTGSNLIVDGGASIKLSTE